MKIYIHFLTLNPVTCIEAHGKTAKYRRVFSPVFFFFYSPHKPPFSTLCQLSGDLLSPQVIQALYPCPHLPVSCFASILTVLFYPINATYPESLFSSDDLCTKGTKSPGLANWLNTKRDKIICRIFRAQGCSRQGEGGLAKPSSQLALLAGCYCQLSITYWSGI